MNSICTWDWDLIIKSLSPIATLIAAFSIFWLSRKYNESNKKIAEEKLEKELFKEFNERYDNLNEDLIEARDNYMYADKKDKLLLSKSIIDYFNLCAEEYYWREKGRISDKIWFSWRTGMIFNYKSSTLIQELWDVECENEGYKSYYLTNKDELFK